MIDKEMAKNYAIGRTYPKFETDGIFVGNRITNFVLREVEGAFLAGLNIYKPKWHNVADGDLPNTEFSRVDVTIAYIDAYGNSCKRDCCFDGNNFIYWDDRKPIGWKNVDIFGKIYAWKYPEKFPEIPEDIE